MPEGRSALGRLAELASRRPAAMLLAWIVLLAVVNALAPRIAGEFTANYATPGAESSRAATVISQRFPGTTGDTIDVVWQARSGVRTAKAGARMRRFLERAARLEGIGVVEPARVSGDGTIALAQLDLDRRAWLVPKETGERLVAMARAASRDGLRVELAGDPIRQVEGAGSPELVGLLAAALILVLAFGSLIAAALPLIVALFGIGLSMPLIGVLAAAMDVPEWAPAVAALIGLGVGIDYALLIVTRYRAALAAAATPHDALVEAVATAGRSTLIAGCTVVISVLGLFLMRIPFLQGVALAASVGVLAVMAAALTLLPALLALAGRRVDARRRRGLGRPERSRSAPSAARWSRIVQRRPRSAALCATAVLLTLAAPALGLRLGFPDAGNDRAGATSRMAYDLVARGFGRGANGPLLLVAELPRRRDARALRALADSLRGRPDVASVSDMRVAPAGDAAIVTLVPATAPDAPATMDLVRRLRDRVLPTAERGRGPTVLVGGATAALLDQSKLVADRLPAFIAGVIVLSFVLLLTAFRSPLIAMKAGAMNLLSIGAAYGVVALVAHGGSAGRLLGIDTDTPVPPFIPVMMFAILFGVSMDYGVFLLSRVREEYLRSGDTSRAVTDGVAGTARVISAAAAIMVAVFLAFALASEVVVKLLGVGMATAILVDATLVRLVLVPATMQLLGGANWWIPRWLDRRLPRLAGATAAPRH